MRTTRIAVLVVVVLVVGLGASGANADTVGPEGFEGFAVGSPNGQFGWSATGSAGSGCATYDHAIVLNTSAPSSFGTKSLRMSNAVTSGCFGDQTFSASTLNEAGETGAANGGLSGGTRQLSFQAEWQFASTVPGAEQPGLSVVASPDRGDGARMSWVQMADTPGGLQVNFFDYQDVAPFGSLATPTDGFGTGDDFVFTTVASGLSRSVPHTIRISMTLVDGQHNDAVTVCVDNTFCHTGTSWEDFFRFFQGPGGPEWDGVTGFVSRTVDSVLFRTGGTAAPGTAGAGFLIDNLTNQTTDLLGPCTVSVTGSTITLLADCTTDHTIFVPHGFTLQGAGHTITAVDPPTDHFRGAVVQNAGTEAHVTNLGVTASGLADVCDAGVDRLRGILLDGAAGSITNNTVLNINQGASGCQEGTGIEVRNGPFDNTGTNDLPVTISGNVVTNYQKNGITANGSVAATITGNIVTGAGPVNYIAQNGIQVGFGGTAFIRGNTVSGNDYTPPDTIACGLLYFQADGVRASKTIMFANEMNVCNFGQKGGGQFNPNP